MSRYDLVVVAVIPGLDLRAAATLVSEALRVTGAEAEAALETLPLTLARGVDEAEATRLLDAARGVGLRAEGRPARDAGAGWLAGDLQLEAPRRSSPTARSAPPAPTSAPPPSSGPRAGSGPPPAQPPRASSTAHLDGWSLDELGPPLELDLPEPPPRPAEPAPPEASSPPPAPAPHELATRPSHRAPQAMQVEPAAPALDPGGSTSPMDPDAPFAEQLRAALEVPFSAQGVQWFLQFVGVALGGAVLSIGTMLFGACVPGGVVFSLGGMVLYGGLVQALVVRWFRATLAAAHEGTPLPPPASDLAGDALVTGLMIYLVVLAVNGLAIALWASTRTFTQDPAIVAMHARALVRFLVPLNVVIALHQPLGLAFLVAREEKRAYFDVRGPARLFAAAPFDLLAVYALYGAGLGLLAIVVAMLGQTGSLLLALVSLGVASLGGFLLYGALGAMLGVLLRRHPEVV